MTVRIDDTIYSLKEELSWDEIFDAVGPHMMDDLYEISMSSKIAARAYASAANLLEDELRLAITVDKPRMVDENFQTIKIQLLSLGLIEKSQKPKREGVFWTLTTYGRLRLFQLRAVKTSSPPDLSSAASVGRVSEA